MDIELSKDKIFFTNGHIVHSFTVRVRYADVDKMGVVYNGNYLRFFEIGRTELMRSIGLPYSEVESKGYILPLIEAKISWKGAARYDDLVEIVTSYKPDTTSPKIRFDYKILVGKKEIASGYTIHSFVRIDNFKAVRPPKFFFEVLEKLK
jgi:acyl-CoA thioester hydrolase